VCRGLLHYYESSQLFHGTSSINLSLQHSGTEVQDLPVASTRFASSQLPVASTRFTVASTIVLTKALTTPYSLDKIMTWWPVPNNQSINDRGVKWYTAAKEEERQPRINPESTQINHNQTHNILCWTEAQRLFIDQIVFAVICSNLYPECITLLQPCCTLNL
jgi:hypothetical protein